VTALTVGIASTKIALLHGHSYHVVNFDRLNGSLFRPSLYTRIKLVLADLPWPIKELGQAPSLV